ncbi:hypothetical protein QBC38DRAFT_512502 [Podospora fimiseda]|uniref:Uncharacterized protein n=1 Tax=Podospora fimiseda TaxID=252190 RepID=A0AAN7BH34_9PEZI|nr:hypothetical protein QBC38DRAFT_512502 [Podospora fimiseda]
MGSAISRCNTRHSGATSSLSEIGQKILDRQPNWLVTPSKWRSHHCDHQPVRYRTPTPYPKNDRKRLLDDTTATTEKMLIIETPTVHHIQVAGVAPKMNQPQVKFPASTITITWECHPRRLNRFERPS